MIKNQRLNSQLGFSLVEALVVSGIMGFVALSASALVFPFFHMTRQVRSNLTDTVDNDLSARVFATELSRSFLMRTPGMSCGTNDSVFKTNDTSSPFLMSEGEHFAFLTSTFSTTGARDKASNEDIAVSDPLQFPTGSLLMAMSPVDSTAMGLFRVRESDLARSRLTLEEFSMSSNPTSCSFSGTLANLENLFQSSKGSTLNVHRVKIIHYLRKGPNILKAVFPEDGDITVPRSLAFSTLKSLEIKSNWKVYQGDRSGRWSGEVSYEFEYPSIVKNQPSKIVKTNTTVSFDLAGTKRTNTAAKTTSQLETLVYPTCAVTISSSPIELSLPKLPQFNNSKIYLVEGSSSLSTPASINASLQQGAGSFTSCYRLDAALYADPFVTTPGISGSLGLTSAGGGFTKYLCAVRGQLSLTATMKYYDASLKRSIGVTCSEASINTATVFAHKGGQGPRCYHDGQIDFGGPLVTSSGGKPGPVLHVGQQSCRWSDSGSDFVSCEVAARGPASELREVRILPQGLTGFANGQGHYEINCTN